MPRKRGTGVGQSSPSGVPPGDPPSPFVFIIDGDAAPGNLLPTLADLLIALAGQEDDARERRRPPRNGTVPRRRDKARGGN